MDQPSEGEVVKSGHAFNNTSHDNPKDNHHTHDDNDNDNDNDNNNSAVEDLDYDQGSSTQMTNQSSRSWLYIQASVWRFLMSIGMFLHTVGWTRPPRPSFTRRIPFGNRGGRTVDLYFYCPPSYWRHRKLNRRRRLSSTPSQPFPVVVNFHGGGFTLGTATDDSFWAKCVLQETEAVYVSVNYRLAPEHPFPAAVDDGVETLLYLAANASELAIDASRIALTGFSSGGNLAITVPLRLQHRIQNESGSDIANVVNDIVHVNNDNNNNNNIEPFESTQNLVGENPSNLTIVATFAWYPLLDFVASRDHRRATSAIPGKTMPSFLTNLFDESYLPDPQERYSPFASPERASDEMLSEALPHHIFLYTCEWDMLLNEGQRFVRRLDRMGKRVRAMMIEKVPHAWDKSPNPFRNQEEINVIYRSACAEMKAIFDQT